MLHFLRKIYRLLYHSYQQRYLPVLRLSSLPILRQVRSIQFRRLTPLRNGRQPGTFIVRYYWAHYLHTYRKDIYGRALEIGAIDTLVRYGGAAVTCAEGMDIAAHSPDIKVIADLAQADRVPSNTYDCFINQFTMHLIYDLDAALYHSIRILKPGGTLLVNFTCVDYYFARGLDMGTGAPLFVYWSFTPIQVENLLRRAGLTSDDYSIDVYGNLFTRVADQLNLSAEELTRHELDYADPGHPLLICARIVKPAQWNIAKPTYHSPWQPSIAPAQWNDVTGHYTSQ
jgi:hypothetical protein